MNATNFLSRKHRGQKHAPQVLPLSLPTVAYAGETRDSQLWGRGEASGIPMTLSSLCTLSTALADLDSVPVFPVCSCPDGEPGQAGGAGEVQVKKEQPGLDCGVGSASFFFSF